MTDIALLGKPSFLFEKLFQDACISYQFLEPDVLLSPFLPRYRMLMIPTGFANPRYSNALPVLERIKSRISDFVNSGGVLTVFGPLVEEHDYSWLPIPLRYISELGSQNAQVKDHDCTCILCTPTPECDGYLIPGKEFEIVMTDKQSRPILAIAKWGEGFIIATSIHEFPTKNYINWSINMAKPSKL